MIEKDRRLQKRVPGNYPLDLVIDAQITLQGTIKDLSTTGAFILINNSVVMKTNDQFDFRIHCKVDSDETGILGTACIARIVEGEGIAVYFTKMDKDSTERLKKLVELNK